MEQRINRNIPLLFLMKICHLFMLYMPVVKLFYVENNLKDFDLFFLHAIYSAVIFLTEIPSGYIADVWGRKKSMQLGLFMGLLGFVTYSFSYGFWGFLLAEIALGIGQGFISGSDSALLYDSLLQQKKQNRYIRYEGQISGAGNIAEALAGIVVSLIAFTTMRNYYYIQAGLSGLALTFSWCLTEPRVHGQKQEISVQHIIRVVKDTLWKNRKLSRYVIFSGLIGFSSLSMAWFAQIFIYEASVPAKYFGYLWTLLNGMVALGSFSAHFADRFLGPRYVLFYILLFMSGGYFVASQTIAPYGILFLLLFYYARGTAHPILKDRINTLTESNVRATVLSVRSLLIRILFAGLGPFLGWFTQQISLSFALILAGSVILLPGMILLKLLAVNKSSSGR